MPKIEMNYVVEAYTQREAAQEEHTTQNQTFKLITQSDFVEYYQKINSCSEAKATEAWNNLMGYYPNTGVSGKHPQIHFLTEDSLSQILTHLPQFISGVDYQHLPAGFMIARNPFDNGVRNVLHFSEFVASHQEHISPLALVLSAKLPEEHHNPFEGNQARWYEFFLSQIKRNDDLICSQTELYKAFVHFSNRIEGLGLHYSDLNIEQMKITEDFNPIVLLGRWETILFNHHLKKEDKQYQWQALPSLDCASAYADIRAITDTNMSFTKPCGFILPEMYPTEVITRFLSQYQYNGVKPVFNYHSIDSEYNFWRFIAHTPRRNSIEFYRHCIEQIKTLPGAHNIKFYVLLAGSTTASNHQALTTEQEAKEQVIWNKVCETVNGIESSSLTIRGLVKLLRRPQAVQNDFINHITRWNHKPNIKFLGTITQYIQNYLSSINLFHFAKIAANIHPLAPLIELSDQIDDCLHTLGMNFYKGARFYFIDGAWKNSNVKEFTELQYYHLKRSHPAGSLFNSYQQLAFAPLISTFQLKSTQDLDELKEFFQDPHESQLYGLALFDSVHTPLQKADLLNILAFLEQQGPTYESYEVILDYIENEYSRYFPEQFIEIQKENLRDKKEGLNASQIQLLTSYSFNQSNHKAIIKIESALQRHGHPLSNDMLLRLNEHFFTLSECLIPEDFDSLLKRLVHIRQFIPNNPRLCLDLLTHIIKHKSLTAFNLIYLRNMREKIADNSLWIKLNIYLKHESFIRASSWNINPIPLYESFASLILKSAQSDTQMPGFEESLKESVAKTYHISQQHPQAQEQLINILQHLAKEDDTPYHLQVNKLMACIENLSLLFPAGADIQNINNMQIFHSLITHYQNQPLELITLSDSLYQLADAKMQAYFFNLVSEFLNSEQSLDDLNILIGLCKDNPTILNQMSTQCTTPPYPTLHLIISWIREDKLEEKLESFRMRPFGERHLEYTFNPLHYKTQQPLFFGVASEAFTPQLGLELHQLLEANRAKSITALQNEITELRGDGENPEKLLTLCIEMLARTAYQMDGSNPPKASSMELNTTQVMTLYAMLKTNNPKVMNQIDTGEGKSRIMMVLAAVQALSGKTVDFITSDMQLAERDYFVFKQFFTALNIPSSLISLNTPGQLYRKGGVNFSDMAQLLLLRNRSDIDNKQDDFLDTDISKRCLLLDEEDKFIHDKSSDAFNYATKSKRLAGYTWIYPLLVDFVEQQQALQAQDDEAKLASDFLHYVATHDSNIEHQAAIGALHKKNPQQLTIWLNSAATALQLKAKKDYILTPEDDEHLFAVRDAEGLTRYTRKVLVLDNGRPMEGSSFADGVQQCICAIENKKLSKEVFVILPENETQRSSYVDSFIELYPNIYGVSGTTRWEAPSANDSINHPQYQYIVTPREKKLMRQEKRTLAAGNEKQLIQFIKKEILESFKAGKSFLLICRDDQQSELINNALQSDEALNKVVTHWQRVHGLSTKKEEHAAEKLAGTPGCVTISNAGMFARGKDIRADELAVRAAFVPSLEDEIQIKGRTGRFGRPGDYRMIVNVNDPANPIAGNTYNIDNSVHAKQVEMGMSATMEEEISKVYADFLEYIHQEFLKEYHQKDVIEQLPLLQQWQDYLDDTQKNWGAQRKNLLLLLEQEKKEEFISSFNLFADTWIDKMPVQDKPVYQSQQSEKIYASVIAQKSFFKPKRQPIRVQSGYDKSDDGQARIYSGLFMQTRATLRGERPLFADFKAWREGRGALFPDLMATLKGERPLFANLRATIAYLIDMLKAYFRASPQDAQQTNDDAVRSFALAII